MRTELHGKVAREVLDGRDIFERLPQPLVEEPLETITLDGDKIRYLEDLWNLCERAALAFTSRDKRGSCFAAHQAIPPKELEAAYVSRKTSE
jgi:hypothetical protein